MSNTDHQGCLTALLRVIGLTPKPQKAAPTPKTNAYPYGLKSSLLSPAEISFYHCLKQVVEQDYLICPYVRLADILFVQNEAENKQGFQNKINSKHLDFVLCCPQTLAPLLAIELDDSSHRTNPKTIKNDTFKDEALKSAALKLIRIKAAKSYRLDALRELILPAIPSLSKPSAPIPVAPSETPLCPKCGVEMVKRKASKGKNRGKVFWGCVNY